MTAYATVETAVEAVRRGAWDYLPKPFTPAQIRYLLEKVQAQRSISVRLADLQERLQAEAPETDLESAAPVMRAAFEVLSRAAQTDVSVLFRGETGTGKGVLARAMHIESRRRDHPFVTVNCPTLTEALLASELFGHARGAFTGAIRDQPGRVEVAEGGTLLRRAPMTEMRDRVEDRLSRLERRATLDHVRQLEYHALWQARGDAHLDSCPGKWQQQQQQPDRRPTTVVKEKVLPILLAAASWRGSDAKKQQAVIIGQCLGEENSRSASTPSGTQRARDPVDRTNAASVNTRRNHGAFVVSIDRFRPARALCSWRARAK